MTLRFATAVLAATPLIISAAAAQRPDSLRAPVRPRSITEDLQLFSQVLNQIRVNHPDSLDTHELLMSAIDGMVSAADPHSYVVPATRLDAAKDAELRAGKLAPLPIAFRFIAGAPIVAAVAPGSRAATQDILSGDELISADGHPVAATSSDELELALAGRTNSPVALLLRRRHADGSIAQLTRSVVRERVDESSAVPAALLLDQTTGYVRVTTFMGDRVADDLHSALGRLEHSGMTRLVLDLRGNGGGRVDEAKRIASEFLPRGTVVYTASGRKPEVNDTGRVQRSFWQSERRYPIVVLVDAGTASASELVAGALQDHDRALIVGQTTFGKSLIMQTFPLTDGSYMSLVVGTIHTPCGRAIQRDYHAQSRREYYREAGQEQASGDRQSCKTDHGRTVFGGGGIVPDVQLRVAPVPVWLSRLSESGVTLTWTSGYLERAGAAIASIDSLAVNPALDAATLASFRSYAATAGVTIPDDADTNMLLAGYLVRSIAQAKFGDTGYYRLVALTDPSVRRAREAFDQAAALLAGSGD